MRKTKKNILLAIGVIFVILYAIICVNITKKIFFASSDEELRAFYIDGSTDSVIGHTETDGAFASAPNLNGLKVSLKAKDTLVLREVIDLNNYGYSKPVIRISVAPKTIGKGQFYCLKVDLVDVYDPNNYITVQLKPYNGQTNEATAGYYLTYASNGQYPTGKDTSNSQIFVNQWGTWTSWNFGADSTRTDLTPENQCFAFGYDIKTNATYCHRNRGGGVLIVADYDDPRYFNDTLWGGFTTGEVYARVYCEDYEDNLADLVIQQYGDFDLTKPYIQDEKGPSIIIDYKGYSNTDMPVAVVGKEYNLFNAVSKDLYSGETDTDINVYTNYYSNKKHSVSINKRLNKFVPSVAGIYYAEYSSSDHQGHKSVEVLQIRAVEASEKVNFTFSDYQSSVTVGDEFILPGYEVSGGSGKNTVEIHAYNEGAELQIHGNMVRPFKTGKITASYTATDYLGQTKTQTIQTNVVATDKPTFIEKPALPIAFVEGNRYTLPIINAYDYVNGKGSSIQTEIKITNGSGQTAGTLNGNVYIPKVSNNNEIVTVSYVAEVNRKSNALVYRIPVIKAENSNGYDMTKLFIHEDVVSVTAHENGIDFATSSNNNKITFANALESMNASMEFTMNKKSSKMGKFSITLTDYYDVDNKITFTYDTSSGGCVYLNGNKENAVAASVNFSERNKFVWSYNNTDCKVSYSATENRTLVFDENLSGKPFEGFSKNKFYITFEMENVTGESGFMLTIINGHFFDDSTAEWVGPNITMNGLFGGNKKINTQISLASAAVCDVICGEVDVFLTMTDPEGNIVRDVKGVELNDIKVNADDEVVVLLDKYGVYFVNYYSVDNSSNDSSFRYSIRVVDDEKPIITLSGEPVKQCKVGDLVIVPSATVKDNKDIDVELDVYLVTPTAEMIVFNKNNKGFKAMAAGEYKIIYKAMDSEGNLTTVVKTIIVKEG